MNGKPDISAADALEMALDILREHIPNCAGVVVVAAVDDGDADYVRFMTGSALPSCRSAQIKSPREATDAMLEILYPAIAVMESEVTERKPLNTDTGEMNPRLADADKSKLH